jgi:hypothetical protein
MPTGIPYTTSKPTRASDSFNIISSFFFALLGTVATIVALRLLTGLAIVRLCPDVAQFTGIKVRHRHLPLLFRVGSLPLRRLSSYG